MSYIDHILIYSPEFNAHLKHLESVFKRLIEAKLKLKISKCSFLCEQVTFLRNILSADGIQPDPKKIEAIKNYPKPRNVRELQEFLGFVQWLHRFIPGLAEIAVLLYELTSKKSTTKWGPEHDKAFEDLKTAFTSPPVLGYPVYNDPNHTFILSTDASDNAMGAVLSQTDE